MKIEHYNLVSDHFNLRQYSITNFLTNFESRSPLETFYIATDGSRWTIRGASWNFYIPIVTQLPTRELAEEILQYIKDTEILFI